MGSSPRSRARHWSTGSVGREPRAGSKRRDHPGHRPPRPQPRRRSPAHGACDQTRRRVHTAQSPVAARHRPARSCRCCESRAADHDPNDAPDPTSRCEQGRHGSQQQPARSLGANSRWVAVPSGDRRFRCIPGRAGQQQQPGHCQAQDAEQQSSSRLRFVFRGLGG